MYKSIEEHINDNDRFGNCDSCNERTSNVKLKEFEGKCEECYYKDKE